MAQNRCAAPIMHHVAAGEWTPRGEQASLQETTCSLLMAAAMPEKANRQRKRQTWAGLSIARLEKAPGMTKSERRTGGQLRPSMHPIAWAVEDMRMMKMCEAETTATATVDS